MAADVKCPKEEKLIPVDSCLDCEYVRNDDDVSNIWCRYLIGKREESTYELKDLFYQLQYKEEQMARAYKMGRTKLGDNISWEIKELNRKIQERKE